MDILLMRHGYDDHSFIDGKNDTNLTVEGVKHIKDISIEIAKIALSKYESGISINSSSKRRAVQTAEIISETLHKNHFDHSFVIDDRLRELYQGEIINVEILSHQDKKIILQRLWEIFNQERNKDNFDYKFGSPAYCNDSYCDMDSFIKRPYGESHNELVARVLTAFMDIINHSETDGRTPLIVAHRGTIREMLSISNSAERLNSNNFNQEMSVWKYGELITHNIDDVSFCLSAIKNRLSKI